MRHIETQIDAIDLLEKGHLYIVSNDTTKRAILALWVAWKAAMVKETKETKSLGFVEYVQAVGNELNELAETLMSCDRFHIPKVNGIDPILGGVDISQAFAFITRTGHQSKDVISKLRKAHIAKIPFRTMCGLTIRDNSETDETRKVA